MDTKTSAAPMTRPRLVIDERAYPRLLALAERARAQAPELADRLMEEIERAELRPSSEMPHDVVTLGSEVTFRQDHADMDVRGRATQGAVAERTQTVQIVAPEDADIERRRISVLSPVGAALLGLAVGQKISWPMPDKHSSVLEVVAVRQPHEAAPH